MKFGELRGVEEIGVCPFFFIDLKLKKKNERKLENSEKYEIKESISYSLFYRKILKRMDACRNIGTDDSGMKFGKFR